LRRRDDDRWIYKQYVEGIEPLDFGARTLDA
jgi:hypothetical protein